MNRDKIGSSLKHQLTNWPFMDKNITQASPIAEVKIASTQVLEDFKHTIRIPEIKELGTMVTQIKTTIGNISKLANQLHRDNEE